MKYGDFKVHLEQIMSGDKKVPTDDSLKPILLQSLIQVASSTEPLVLMSKNIADEMLRTVDNELFIRMPRIPNTDDDIIDIDEALVYAVSYIVASKISSNKTLVKYKIEAKSIISDYQWQRYRDIQSGLFDINKTLAQNSLDIHGYKYIYTSKLKTISGDVYTWDIEFINNLGAYLSGEALELSKSDRLNIDKYLEYQSSGASDNAMYEALDVYLGEING